MSAFTDRRLPSASKKTPFWASWGVAWFRNLRFPAKAAVILVFLLAPTLITMGLLTSDRRAAIEATQQERRGLQGIQLLVPAMDATQRLRRALVDQANGVDRPDVPALRQAFKAAMDQLDQELKPLLDHFGGDGSSHWQAVSAARREADGQASGLNATEVRKPYVVLSTELRGLVQHLVDESGLALDPEGDTYYLMLISTVNLPDLMESAGLTRAALASLAADPGNGKLLARAAAMLAVDKSALSQVRANLARVKEFNDTLPVPRFLAQMAPAQDFVTQMEPLVLAQAAEYPAPAEIVRQSSAAIDSLKAMQAATAAELDTLLLARVDRLNGRLAGSLLVIAVLVLGGLYFFYCFFLSMRSGMKVLTVRMHAMAEGDLTNELVPKGRDETSDLLRSLAEMQTSLRGTVRSVREAADAIRRSSSEVASGSMDLSQRTEQAAANLEETASAMEQIGATVTSTAEGANQASSSAANNIQMAQRGGEVIGQVEGTMAEIEASSRRIGEIIGVIDSIAFQTNILALNAAVEAARAGEQGRGFAVVASEVRALAQRSASAAREIKQLIQESSTRVDTGQKIVTEAGATIRDIITSTRQVGELLGTISVGAREQAQGVAQVGSGIQELDRMTQQNAALVEETAAAASTLRQQAEQLGAAVDVFRLP